MLTKHYHWGPREVLDLEWNEIQWWLETATLAKKAMSKGGT